MENRTDRWDFVVFGAFATAVGLLGTGCGALGAATNPKVSWALGDPAPMTVTVRRADVAADTAKHVDRLLMATPMDDDASWAKATAPAPDDAKKQAEEIAKRDMYALTGSRVIPADVWAPSLAAVAPPAPTLTSAAMPQAEEAKPAEKGKPKKKPAAAKAAPPPPPPAPPKYPNVIAAIDPALVDKYAAVMAKTKAIGDTEGQIEREEAALDTKGIGDAEKKEHKDKIAALEASADKMRAEAKDLHAQFALAARGSAAKTAPEMRERVGVVFVNLRQAVEDASIANGAAALRYPLALPTLPQAAEEMVHVYVADVVEERTGKRPATKGLQPGISLEGGNVQITLNGLTADDMGKVSIGDLTSETAKRTQTWVTHAVGLLGTVASTKEVLELQRDVLDAVLGGFAQAGWKAPPAPMLPVVIPPPPKQQPARGGKKGQS